MTKIKILHVIDTTGPGGAETVFTDLCSHFNCDQYRSIALIRGPGWVASRLETLGIETHIADCKGSFNLNYLWHLIKLIRIERVQLIHAHLLGSNVYCAIAGLLTLRPVVCTFHGLVDIRPDERFLFFKFLFIRLRSRVVAVSKNIYDSLISRELVSPKRTSLIENGIDCDAFHNAEPLPLRQTYALPSDAIVLGALGNLRPAKDYETALRAMAQISLSPLPVYLFIAGDTKTELFNELSQLVHTLGISDRVFFIGFLRSPEKFLAALDIYLLSSRSEGLPLALVQAMASGLPIVATQCGVEQVLVDGETALLTPVAAPLAISQAILRLAADKDLRQHLGSRARSAANRGYDVANTATKYKSLYATALEKNRVE